MATLKRSHDEAMGEADANNDHGEGLFVEDEDMVPPYDASTETLPPCKLYTTEFKFLGTGKAKMSDLLDKAFRDNSFRSGHVTGLQNELKRRIQDPSSEKIRIGIVGGMKSGKSSVVNSLLSMGVIARQGDAGKSCTWVSNEFGSPLPNQTKSFAAEIFFFTQAQRYELFRVLVADFYHAHPTEHDGSDGTKDADQICEDIATKNSIAGAFCAMFFNQPEFADTEKAKGFLSSAESEDDSVIIDHLCNLSDALMESVLRGQSSVRFEAATSQSLLSDIGPFQHTVEEVDSEPIVSLWPLVNHIKFGLDCKLLQNVTLVDLPGTTDANKIRRASATTHLRTCTHTMVVAEIGRATDDGSICQHLASGFYNRGPGRNMLVLTHADTIDDATEVTPTRNGQKLLDELVAEMKEHEKKKQEWSSKIRGAKGAQKYEFMDAKEEVVKQLRTAQAKHRELRIHMRSRNVIRDVRSTYSQLAADPQQLPVFCVGNGAYKQHQTGYSVDDAPPSLSVSGTKIPALRQHLLRAPMEGRLNEMCNQVIVQSPAVLRSFELYIAKTHMDRKDEIEQIVLAPQYAVQSIVEDAFHALKREINTSILGPLARSDFDWTTEAEKLCYQWEDVESTASHLALLKKEGVRKGTKKSRAANWNLQLVQINSDHIRECFGNFDPSVEVAQRAIVKEINTLVTKMSHSIKSDPQVALMALQPFLDFAYAEKPTINNRAAKPMRSLRKEIGDILRAATTDEFSNPVVRAMAPIYVEARKIKAKAGIKGGTPGKRLVFFRSAVSRQGNGVWMEAHDLLKQDLLGVLDEHANQLTNAMMMFFRSIDEKFNMMCAENGTEDEREVVLREMLGKNTLQARELFEKELLPAAKKFFATEKQAGTK